MGIPRFLPLYLDQNDASGQPLYAQINERLVQYLFSISGSGTVTTVGVNQANGLQGSVATPTTTPNITLSTTVTGILKGNAVSGVISAAVANVDYLNGIITANIQTTNYTPIASDANKVIEMSSSSPLTLTLPENIFTAGQTFEVCQVGTGAVTFVAGTGVTLDAANGDVVTNGQWSMATVRWRSATECVVAGNLIT